MNTIATNKTLYYGSIAGIIVASLLLAGSVSAEETTETSAVKATTKPVPVRAEVKAIRAEAKEEIKDIRTTSKQIIDAKRGEIKETMTSVREDGMSKDEAKTAIDAKRADIKAVRASTTEAVKEKREESKVDAKTLLAERRAKEMNERVSNYVDKIVERLEAAVERIETLSERTASRITKIEAAGGKADASKKLLSDAAASLVLAKANIAAIPAAIPANLASSTPQQTYEAINAAVAVAKGNIEKASESVTRAIAGLKGMSTAKPEEKRAATSTTEKR